MFLTSKESGEKFSELLEIISRLRAPDGCPWDQKQTIDSFKPFFIEECHELSEALDSGDTDHIREELGDLFFQLGFINQLYQEKNNFTMPAVLQSIIDKMIRRHPHVFEDITFDSEDDMRRNWARIKEQENKKKKKKTYALDVPKSLPALSRSLRVSSRAARTGFDWPDVQSLQNKLSEEFAEISKAINSNNINEIEEELGDMLLMLVNVGRKFNINSEDCLHNATNKFIHRFKKMEDLISEENCTMEKMAPETQLKFWENAKKGE